MIGSHPWGHALRSVQTGWRECATLVASMALPAGVAAAIVHLLYPVLWVPLPWPEPDRLVTVASVAQDQRVKAEFSVPEYRALSETLAGRATCGGFGYTRAILSGEGGPVAVTVALVTPEYFRVLSVPALRGRVIDDTDATRMTGGAVISRRLWREHFDGRWPLAAQARLAAIPTTIVGVIDTSGAIPTSGLDADIWVPVESHHGLVGAPPRPKERGRVDVRVDNGYWWLWLIARVGDRGEMAALAAHVTAGLAQVRVIPGREWRAVLTPLSDQRIPPQFRAYVAETLTVLGTCLALLLVSALMTATVALCQWYHRRQREFFIREAVGASRAQTVRLLAIEALLITTAAAGCAIGLACVLTFAVFPAVREPFGLHVAVEDWTMVSSGVAVAVVVLLAVLAWAGAAAYRWYLRGGALEGRADDKRGLAAQRALVGAQAAGAFALVVVLAGVGTLLVSLLNRHASADARVVLVSTDLRHHVDGPAKGPDVYYRMLDVVRGVRGVTAVTLTRLVPYQRTTSNVLWAHDPRPREGQAIDTNIVGPGYFTAVGAHLLQGDDFDRVPGATDVAILSQSLAAIRNSDGTMLEAGWGRRIIGITTHEIPRTVTDEPGRLVRYVPVWQTYDDRLTLYVVTDGRADATLDATRAGLRAFDPDLPVYNFRTMKQQLAEALWEPIVVALGATIVAVATLLLLVLGVAGTITFSWRQRQRALAIRSVLGASPAALVRRALAEILITVTLGAAVGGVIAGWIGQVLSRRVVPMEPLSAAVLGGALLLLWVAAAVSGWWALRTASRFDPAVILKAETV